MILAGAFGSPHEIESHFIDHLQLTSFETIPRLCYMAYARARYRPANGHSGANTTLNSIVYSKFWWYTQGSVQYWRSCYMLISANCLCLTVLAVFKIPLTELYITLYLSQEEMKEALNQHHLT